MSRYIPQPAYPDNMPVDISFVFEDEKPAGKHGFVHADGDSLRFADGTLARFWGVNFNGGACFPDKDYAPKVAHRLAQTGCNIVRFHQLDAEWDTPNIFSYAKGKRVETTRVLDKKSLDALDYLVFCLKEEGIYCYLDMMTYRKFKSGDGVRDAEKMLDAAKPWALFDPYLIQLQKEYCDQLWNHYNPYTKLLYKDDPVFVMSEIVNESDLFVTSFTKKVNFNTIPYYENEFRTMFHEWLVENKLEFDWENCDIFSDKSEILIQFKLFLTEKHYQEIYDYMRNTIGVRIPITGTNWIHDSACALAQENMDFTDAHTYFYDWHWGNTERFCLNKSITSVPSTGCAKMAKMKLAGKPFFCSEWDMPWPNSYRAESPIYYAAVGALQNWSGYTIHTYAYSTKLERMQVLGRELSSPVGGVPYREGIFSVWNDPAKFGLFYHSALILRRGDVSPADKVVGIHAKKLDTTVDIAQRDGLEQHRIATYFGEEKPACVDETVEEEEHIPHADPNRIVSDNGQMWRDLKRQIGAVDTERTKVFYGFLGRGGSSASTQRKVNLTTQVTGLAVNCSTDFGVIAMSSLTDAPISESNNILLSTIGRARNTNAQFDGEKMLDVGQPPIMAEVIEADIHLTTTRGDKLKVWGVNAEGFYAGNLPTTYEDGVLSFHVGDANNPACYYLIVED